METVKSFLKHIPITRPGSKTKFKSLSDYLPEGTVYYYGYPAGEDSGFLNKVPPTIEELVAARVFSCAGDKIKAVGFAATTEKQLDKRLMERLALPQLKKDNMVIMPEAITAEVLGAERNKLIKQALKESIKPGSLVMAYPYDGDDMKDLYQIDPEITWKLNDKSLMKNYMDEQWFPQRYAVFQGGLEFHDGAANLPVPCVIKAAASSSGDGVYICRDGEDLSAALKDLRHLDGPIIAEQHIDTYKNYVVNFGVPHKADQEIDILGVHEQLTGEDGSFLGGEIKTSAIPTDITEAVDYLRDKVLPRVRELGWYGVGGFDVLLDKSGQAYFIDCNFRINSTSAFHFLNINGVISAPLVSFSAQFTGSQAEFEAAILPFADIDSKERCVQIIALGNQGDKWNLNLALMYSDQNQLKNRAYQLLSAGLESQALQNTLK